MAPLLTLDEVIPACLPVLADYKGVLPLESPHVPPYLEEIAQQYLEAVRDGIRLIIFDLRENRPALPYGGNHQLNTDIVGDADVYQLLHRGLKMAPESQGRNFISLDDRTQGMISRQTEPYNSFENRVLKTEEERGKFFKPEDIGTVFTITNDVARFFNMEQLRSKMQRVFHPEDVRKIIVPPRQESNMYQNWAKELLAKDTQKFRELLIHAATHPSQENTNASEGIPHPLPEGRDFEVQPEQEQSFETILKLLQAQIWSKLSVLIYGGYGKGKTTILMAYAHLLQRLKIPVKYQRVAENQASPLYTFGEPSIACLDQIDRAPSKFDTFKNQFVLTSNDRPGGTQYKFKTCVDVSPDRVLQNGYPQNFDAFSQALFGIELVGETRAPKFDII